MKGRRNEHPIPTWPLLSVAPDTNGPFNQKHLDFTRGSGGGEALLMELHQSWEATGTGCRPGTRATSPHSSLGCSGSWSALLACGVPRPSVPDLVYPPCGRGATVLGQPERQRWAVPPGGMHMRRAAAWPCRRLPRPKRARKANKDVLVSALLEAQEGGNQCLVNVKRENRSEKAVYFQAGEGFVNSTGHCEGSTVGHKTPPAEEEECSHS